MPNFRFLPSQPLGGRHNPPLPRARRLPSAEALDPREGRWVPLPHMSAARSSCGAAELHGSVYVVGGNVGQDIHEVS